MNHQTFEEVEKLLAFDPESGAFTWLPRSGDSASVVRWNARFASKPAGALLPTGYIGIRLNGDRFLAHRLAWLLTYRRWPEGWLDHKNGDPSDNRIANLRECSPSENHQNRAIQSNNTSGCVGVSFNKHARKWVANIGRDRKQFYLGRFSSREEAEFAYLAAKRVVHTFQPVPR